MCHIRYSVCCNEATIRLRSSHHALYPWWWSLWRAMKFLVWWWLLVVVVMFMVVLYWLYHFIRPTHQPLVQDVPRGDDPDWYLIHWCHELHCQVGLAGQCVCLFFSLLFLVSVLLAFIPPLLLLLLFFLLSETWLVLLADIYVIILSSNNSAK